MKPEAPNVIKVTIDLEMLTVKTKPGFISETKYDQLILACAPEKFYPRLELFDDSRAKEYSEIPLAYVKIKNDEFTFVNKETGRPMRHVTYFRSDV